MSKDELPKLIQDLLYAEKHRLLDDAIGQAAKRAVETGVADEFVRGLIHEPVRKHKIAQAFAGPFELPKLRHGKLVAGFDLHGHQIRFPIQYLNGHCLTLGGSGCGKTTKSRWLILQIAANVKGMWLFDIRKREFAPLRPYLARLGVDLIIVPARKLRLNPLQVPAHVDPWDWAPRLADMLVQVLCLPPRAAKLFHTTILELYRKSGVLTGGRKYPTLFDLRETVAADDKANHQARLAVIDTLDPVLLSLRPALCYRLGWPTHELAKRHIVVEFGGTSEVDKNLILNSLILPEFTSRVAQGISNPHMDLWVCCDEAARLVSASGPGGGVSDLIGLIRGTGVGLDLSIQSADVAPAILSNTASKFIGRCGSASDYDTVGTAMGLTAEQRRFMANTLVPGLFVGQVGEGSWRYPFVMRIPEMSMQNCGSAPAGNTDLCDLKLLPTDLA